jgi:hypothetical protein
MEEVNTVYFFQASDVQDYFGGPYTGPRKLNYMHETVVKRRVRANPFGFTPGVNGNLNSSQMAILAALGLTKVRT